MRYLGIDYGKKRVGVAVTDESGQFALPYSVLKNDKELIDNVKKICHEKEVSLIVMGESKDYKGEENTIMADIKKFKQVLLEQVKIPVIFEPEFLTSAEAERIQGKNDMHDASAAAIILKSYIDKSK